MKIENDLVEKEPVSGKDVTRQATDEGVCPECFHDKWWTINEEKWPNLIECGNCGHPRLRLSQGGQSTTDSSK